MQGFLNHCRIKHDMEFPSHSEAARACGAPVVGTYVSEWSATFDHNLMCLEVE